MCLDNPDDCVGWHALNEERVKGVASVSWTLNCPKWRPRERYPFRATTNFLMPGRATHEFRSVEASGAEVYHPLTFGERPNGARNSAQADRSQMRFRNQRNGIGSHVVCGHSCHGVR